MLGIAGFSSSALRVALRSSFPEWTPTNANSLYATRVANLLNGGGANGATKFNSSTVHDDLSAAEKLTGGADSDWFFRSSSDVLSNFDVVLGEILTSI